MINIRRQRGSPHSQEINEYLNCHGYKLGIEYDYDTGFNNYYYVAANGYEALELLLILKYNEYIVKNSFRL